jgi:hypothetical protein
MSDMDSSSPVVIGVGGPLAKHQSGASGGGIRLEIHFTIADEHDLAVVQRNHPRPRETEVLRVKPLDSERVRASQRDVVESDFRHRYCLPFWGPGQAVLTRGAPP